MPWFDLFRRPAPVPAEERLQNEMRPALAALSEAEGDARIAALGRLLGQLRPRRGDRHPPDARVRALAGLLRREPEARARLRAALMHLLAEKQAVHLFSDTGILNNETFSSALSRRISQRLLPDVINTDYLKDVFGLIFHDERDHLWMQAAGFDAWLDLTSALDFETGHTAEKRKLGQQLVAAMEVLSYRITSIGLEPELVRNHAAIERHESPFLTQNAEMRAFVDEWRKAVTDKREPSIDGKQIEVLMEQCTEIIGKIRKQAAKTGASVSLTTLLVRLEQSIARFTELMTLLEAPPATKREHAVRLFLLLVEAENRRHSVRDLFSQNIELLAQRITGNAGRTGEKYITTTRSDYFLLLRAALGAGFIIAFMGLLKLHWGAEPHAPIVTAFLYSMDYGLGFVLIYLLGFTVATKQPAMTASTIAASIRSTERQPDRLEGLADLVVATLRSQFVAIFGNVILAFSVAAMLGHLMLMYGGAPVLTDSRADKVLWELDPLRSPAIIHAAIAGVCLFLSGLISGYFDNRAAYSRIPERIAQLRGLQRLVGKQHASAFGTYIGNHLGGIAGNFFFGVMLGSMGTIGYILGLPIDIRHIAFAAANLAYGLGSLDWALPAGTVAFLAGGVLLIGLTNLAVSFGLALFVAMRAQQVEFNEGGRLMRLLLGRFLRQPLSFFWPPAEHRDSAIRAEAARAEAPEPTATRKETVSAAADSVATARADDTPPPG